MPARAPVNLSSPCSACGHPVGGGLHYCPGCKIALCFKCSIEIMYLQVDEQMKKQSTGDLAPNSVLARARCPMCEKYFPDN